MIIVKQTVKEQTEINTFEELSEALTREFYKRFPKSLIVIDSMKGISTNSYTLTLFFGKDRDEWDFGQKANDVFRGTYWIKGINKDDTLSDTIGMETTGLGGSIVVKSADSQAYRAFDNLKVFRKISTPKDKFVPAVAKYFDKLYDTVKANKDRINVPFDIDTHL